MNNKEAIDRLNDMQSRCENGYEAEAINRAIKALETIDMIKFNVYALNELILTQDVQEV